MPNYKWYGAKAKKKIESVVFSGIRDLAVETVKRAKENASQPKGSELHPQRQTGTLVRSITFDIVKEANDIIAKVGIIKGISEGDEALEYAADVEFGTDTHPPYPYLYPAAAEVTRRVKEYIK